MFNPLSSKLALLALFSLSLLASFVYAGAAAPPPPPPSAAAAPATAAAVQEKPSGKLVRVYPINETQYDAILKLTNGKRIISEARLINSGFSTVSSGISSFTKDISSGWNSFLRIVGLATTTTIEKNADTKIEGEPLCIIKNTDIEYADHPGYAYYDANRYNVDYPNVVYRAGRSARNEEMPTEAEQSVINCVVVVRRHEDERKKIATHYTQYQSPYMPYAPPYYSPDSAAQQQIKQLETQSDEKRPQEIIENTAAQQTQDSRKPYIDDDYDEVSTLAPELLEQLEKQRTTAAPETTRTTTTTEKPKISTQKRTKLRNATPMSNFVGSKRQFLPNYYPSAGYPFGGSVAAPGVGNYGYNPYATYGQQPYVPQAYPASAFAQQPFGQSFYGQQPFNYPLTGQPYPGYAAPSPYPFYGLDENADSSEEEDEEDDNGYTEHNSYDNEHEHEY